MSQRLRTILLQVGSFALAGVLLYFALRGVDFGEVQDALRQANYWWLLPLVAIVLLSHWLRAWRWQALIEALPPSEADGPRPTISVKLAFYSVMIGYMVNYAAPRLGEPVRAANAAARTRLRFGSVFGTVFAERVLDMVTLLLALLSLPVLFLSQLDQIQTLFAALWPDDLKPLTLLLLGAALLVLGGVVLILYRRYLISSEAPWRGGLAERARSALGAFRDGLATLLRTPRRLFVLVTTVAIWICYLLMAHLPFVMLGLAEPYMLSLLDSWGIMLIGAIGMAIPSPGGIGSYHYVTIQTLVHLFGVSAAGAASYAVLSHTAQLILYTLVGFICLLLQGASLRSLRADVAQSRHGNASAPAAPSHEPSHPVKSDH